MSRSIPPLYDRVEAASAYLKGLGIETPRLGIVLGSGLGGLVGRLEAARVIPYADIPHFPRTTVTGHDGNLVTGRLGGVPSAMLQGRFHSYEGHDLETVTFPIRVLRSLGASTLVLTAATGGLREGFGPGTIVCLEDHLNLLGASPLRGPNDDRLGPRFADLTEVYDRSLRAIAAEEASSIGLTLQLGVYAAVPGPNYETPAEVRMIRGLGADVVGMSTVPEAIAACHGGMKVLGFAVVANWGSGILPQPLSHAEVLDAMDRVGPELALLIERVAARIGP
ncbi:MAG: purine-nucleoside phosphorylase [Isosphaeraceae bacterium]